jgi:DNA repair protein RecN (Recombination protein N)
VLEDLHIQDFALIEDVWLEFGPGLTVLTGETGAGKTVLLSALELIMGGRGDAGMVRTGAAAAKVEAQFADGPVVSRSIAANGRNKALLDGDLSTVGALSTAVGPLIDLHGQHEHQALLQSGQHLNYLDRWAGKAVECVHEPYKTAFVAWRAAARTLAETEAALTRGIEEAEAGRIALAEIERVDPQPGEDDELRTRLPALQNSEELAAAVGDALTNLRGEGGALERLYASGSTLERAGAFDADLLETAEVVEQARLLLESTADTLRDYGEGIEHDPFTLEATLDRLAALEGLTKRFGPTLDAVLVRRDHLRDTLDLNEHGEERLVEARAAEANAHTELEAAAAALSKVRQEQAITFIQNLSAASADLELGAVRFAINFIDLPFEQWTVSGSQQSEILYAPAPNVAPRPLAKIASGGEISRVMLALKSVFGASDSTRILVFDEIDAGIGGATGTAVGAKLKELARTHQVIVVTHLAQVAAYANAHFVVRKLSDTDGSVNTVVVPVQGDSRINEVARMLSGQASDVALTHAQELITAATY